MEKVKRPRFNRSQICQVTPENSRESYRISHKAHKEHIEESHVKNVQFVTSILNRPKDSNRKLSNSELATRYREVKVFGQWQPVTKYITGLAMMFYDLGHQFR